MGGAGEEHLAIDLGKTASIVGGVTRAPGSPTPYSATDQIWRVAASKLERAAPAGGAEAGNRPHSWTGHRV
jgi:hypothetical protein